MKKIHAKIIINPAAGDNTTYRRWPGIQSFLKKIGLSFDFQFTEGRGHGIELARDAASNGYRYLVAVGGDGTIHEVANGILQTENSAHTDLGIVNTGTGSDFSRSAGVSRDYVVACTSLANPRKVSIDVGVVEYQVNGKTQKRFFVNSAGIGFDATVVQAVEKMPKIFGGTIPYLIGLFRSFAGYRNKNIELTIGENIQKARVLSVVVANGKYFGGGMQIAPQAQLDDGLLDVIMIDNIGKIELLRTFPRVYKGTHLSHPKVHLAKHTSIAINSADNFLLHADGELLGEGPVSFSILRRSLNLAI